MTLVVRPARSYELEEAGALTVRAYLADELLDDGDGYVPALRDAARRAAQALLLVAVDPETPRDDSGPEVLGTITSCAHGTPYAEIARPGEVELRMLAVHPEARRRGVGELLVRAAIASGLASGASRVVLSTLPAMTTAQRMYDRLGLVRAPERDWSVPGYDMLVYTTPEVPGEEVLDGGGLTRVVRRGDRVHRDAGPWTSAVHGLLAHLRARGLTEVPAPHGVDPEGREVLDHLPGEVPGYPVPEWVWSAQAIEAAGRLLGRVHAAGADLVPVALKQTWREPVRAPAEVVCHNDVAPYNLVFSEGLPVGLIDHDHAAPGPRVRDLAYLAYRMVPLAHPANPDLPAQAGAAERLAALCAAYREASAALDLPELTPADVLAALPARLDDLAAHATGAGQDDHAVLYRRDADHARALARGATGRLVPEGFPSPAPVPGAEVEAATWVPLRTVPVGPWVAGLSEGFTRRANSVAPLPAALPLDDAATAALVDEAELLFSAAGLAPTFCTRDLDAGAGADTDADSVTLGRVLDARGYGTEVRTWTMSARLDGNLVAAPDALRNLGATLTLGSEPDLAWMTTWLSASGRGGDPSPDAVAARVLRSGESAAVRPTRYLTVLDAGGRVVVVARVAYAQALAPTSLTPGQIAARPSSARDGALWAALSCLAVVPQARRRGLARATSLAACAVAAADGAERLLLQVEEDNAVVRPLYEALGFGYAERYVYRTAPSTQGKGC